MYPFLRVNGDRKARKRMTPDLVYRADLVYREFPRRAGLDNHGLDWSKKKRKGFNRNLNIFHSKRKTIIIVPTS